MVGGKCGKKLQKQAAFDKTVCFYWSEMGDSNSRHLAPKPGAIPASLYPDMRVSADKHSAIIAKAAGECKHFLILKKN